MKNLKRLLILASPILLNACTIHQADSHARICFDREADDFTLTVPDKNGYLKPVTFTIVSDISNRDQPINESTFWLRMTGYNRGRKWHTRHSGWESGDEGIPMFYSTKYTYVEKEDGTRVRAAPTIYRTADPDTSQPGRPFEKNLIDINTDELQYNRHGNVTYGNVYIHFDTPPPAPQSKWTIHLGKIQIGDELIDIEPRETCFFEGYESFHWGMNFLP